MGATTADYINIFVAAGAFITAVAALSSLIGLLLNRRTRKAEATKAEAEATEIIGKAWAHVCSELRFKIEEQDRRVKDLQDQVNRVVAEAKEKDKLIEKLRGAINKRDKRIRDLEADVSKLHDQISQMGGKPT